MPAFSRPRLAAACLAAAALLGCGGGETAALRELAMTRLPVSWATTDLRQTYTIRSDAEWQAAWQAHEPRTVPPAARPAVDFSRQMVLGLTRGTGPNGCHGLSIQRVVEHAEQLLVHYAVSTPSGTAACTQALVALTDFVVVERLDKPVSFVQAGS